MRAAIGSLAFPMSCQVCGLEHAGGAFCDGCSAELKESGASSCRRCAMPIGPFADPEGGCSECRGRRLGFDGAIALGPYQGPIRHLCLRLKRLDHAWLAPWLADLLIEARGGELKRTGASVVAPVPLHWSRRWWRGYNQAEAIARRIAKGLRLPWAVPLRRVRATGALGPMGRAARHRHLRGAFRASGRADAIAGRTVLLVDDILTSGATCGAAARALKVAGADRVIVAVIGRAEGRG